MKLPGQDRIVKTSGGELRVRILKPYPGKGSPRIVLLRIKGISSKHYREFLMSAEKDPHIGKVLLLNGFFTAGIQQQISRGKLFGVLLLEIPGKEGSQEFFRNFYEENSRFFDFFELSE